MSPKKINSYILRKFDAETRLASLSSYFERYIELSFEAAANKKSMSSRNAHDMNVIATQINKVETDIAFFEQQIASDPFFLESRYLLN